MSKELDTLHESLKKAQRQVSILCHGFNVKVEPSWEDLVNTVVTSVGEWERTGKLPCKPASTPYVYFASGWQVHSSVTVVAESLPPILFTQFKNKFMTIIREQVLPALKEYIKENPDLTVDIFKPLLLVKVKG